MADDRATRLFKDEYERAKGYRADIKALRKRLRKAERNETTGARIIFDRDAENRRLTDALREARVQYESIKGEKGRLRDREGRLTDALRKLLESGIGFDDERIKYITVQVYREDWQAAERVLAEMGMEE